jgi:hypothetical protein
MDAQNKAAAIEDQQLKLKFRSLVHTAPKRDQKMSEVEEERRDALKDRSYNLWKKLNPGFYDEPVTTTTRDMQQYDAEDFVVKNKDANRTRDRHTDFVNYIARDKVLARGKP